MYKPVLYLCLCFQAVRAAKILGVFFTPIISHQNVYQPIWRELALRGHETTVLTPNPLNDPTLVNLTEIDLSFSYEIIKTSKILSRSATDITKNFFDVLGAVVEAQLQNRQVQNLIRDKSRKFDVMLVEFYHPAMFALSARFACPMIGVTASMPLLNSYDAVGSIVHPVLYPEAVLPFAGNLGFFERVYSAYFTVWFRYHYHNSVMPQQDQVARKYISKDIPYLGEIEKDVHLLLINVNPIINYIRPNVPAMIELWNVRMPFTNPLPTDLQNELDTSKQGAIYFSLGPTLLSTQLPNKTREIIIKALGELQYKVFLKWDDARFTNPHRNIVIRKWFPQQAILGHPNIKVFVTQGGLRSIEEAVYCGVPLVGLPFVAEHMHNIKKMISLGTGKQVNVNRITKEGLKNAIIKVATTSKYRQRMKKVSELVQDQPMTGLEKAVWWTEYVIRHKGAKHLRSPSLDLPLYQYLLLDVIGFLLAVFTIVFGLLYKIMAFFIKILKMLRPSRKEKTS